MKNFKMSIWLVCISIICCSSLLASSSLLPQVIIDNKALVLDNNTGKPYIKNGVTLVPIRVISENLGYKVDWNATIKKITILKETTEVTLTIGSKVAKVNGVTKNLLESPIVKNNRTYVPLRFIGEAFGCEVVWESPTVYISTTGKVILPDKKGTPITDLLQNNKALELLLHTKGDANGQITVTQTTLDEGISLSTPVVTGKGELFTITEMFWSSDDKVILTAFAKGTATNCRAFDVELIKDGKITGNYLATSVYKGSQGQLVFTIQGIGENIDVRLKNADSLLFIGGDGEAILIPNPVNELTVKPFWEY